MSILTSLARYKSKQLSSIVNRTVRIQFYRLTLANVAAAGACRNRRTISTASALLFRATPMLCAEPLKKKKRIDPQVLKNREDRRRKKLEKQIRRLEKNARQLKPIDELEIPLVLIDEKRLVEIYLQCKLLLIACVFSQRTRTVENVTEAVLEQRALLEKRWARHKMHEKLEHYQIVDKLLLSQQKALQELRYESEELYQQAIQPDMELVPFKAVGPVSTPPIENYDMPDGEYLNVSKKWE